MNIDIEPFLQRIRAYPDDDGPRLVLADWLEEQGGDQAARAQFIRVQIALAGLKAGDPRRDDLVIAERTLLEHHHLEWEAPLRRLATGLVFHRGFVEELNVDARDFVRHAHELFAVGPIRHLHLLNLGAHLPDVLASPYLGRLRALTLFAQYAGESMGRALARASNLTGLRALHLPRNRLGDVGVGHLAGSAIAANLEELNLADNELTDTAARAPALSPHFTRLRRLDLRDNGIGPGGAGALAGAEGLGTLTHLSLARNETGATRSQPHSGNASLLRFVALDLAGNGLGSESLKGMLGPRRLTRPDPAAPERTGNDAIRIREFDLSQNDLGEDGARVIAECRELEGLTVLKLAGCGITDTAARILAHSPHLSHLECLEIGNNPVGDRGLGAFLNTSLRRLRRLMIPSFGVSHAMQAALLEKFNGGVIRH